MSKNKKQKSTLKPSNPFKVVLPILIGLVVVLVATIIIAVVSTPKKSAKVENPNETYVKIGDYVVTNQKMYEVLKSQYGVNKIIEIVDAELLKDVVVEDAKKEEILNELIYGEDFEELTDEEKATKLETYENNLKLSGYVTEEQVNAYEDLVCKRTVKAEELYKEYMEDNDYTEDQYLEAFKELDPAKYENKASVIYISFASKAQGEKMLELFGVLGSSVKSASTSSYNGWQSKVVQDEIDALEAENKTLEEENKKLTADKEASTDETEKATLQETIDANAAKLVENEDKIKELETNLDLDAAEVALTFIKLYNYVNAYYAKDFDESFFDVDGNLVAGKELLQEGVHYEIVSVEAVEDDAATEDIDESVPAYQYVKFNEEKLAELNESNSFCKFVFTEEEADAVDEKFDSSSSTGKFSDTIIDLDVFENHETTVKNTYTTEFKAMASGEYFLAYKFAGHDAEEVEYDFGDDAEEEKKPTEALLAELKEDLIVSQFNDDIETQMLLQLRQENNIKFYDRFLNATYKAAYVYLYETTLELVDYPEYAENNKTSKTLAFSYEVNGEVVEYTAQKLFEVLSEQYGAQSTVRLVNAYALLANPKYNEIYNPYTDEIYDEETYTNVVSGFNYYNLLYGSLTTVKEYKYAFENGVFETYGFAESYGWSNFVRDYLVEDNTDFLAGALSQGAAESNYLFEKYNQDDILAEMKKLYDEYFSLDAVNLLVYVNYDTDAAPDEYNTALEAGETQEFWTEAQLTLANELVAKLYEAKEAVSDEDEETLEDKLEAVVKEYNEASYTDATWGKYLRAGLKVKTDSGEYTSSESEATELLNKEFAVIYQAIEKNEDYEIGAEDDYETPYEHTTAVITEYGVYRVAVTNTGKRIVTGDDDATDYTTLTKEVYKKYIKGEELSENVTTGIEYYYVTAVDKLYDENQVNLLIADLRDTLTEQVVFANASQKDLYETVLELIRENINTAIEEAENTEE